MIKTFSEITSKWFEGAYGEPTPVQTAAWPRIAAGGDTLVSAPTGTGKTLSAFLVFIDRLAEAAKRGELEPQLYVVYISPLKSLVADIRENLRKPLNGIAGMESESQFIKYEDAFSKNEYTLVSPKSKKKLPPGAAQITVGVRTGDSTQAERRAMFRNPPHILITTPESLFILLTSLSGVRMLRTANAVIIDELHAMIGSKRGAHLTLSLARLDLLHGGPLQRIGLSATIEPLDIAAAYLSPNGADIVAPKSAKKIELAVKSAMPESGVLAHGSIWPEIAREVHNACMRSRCAIAFVETRTNAEKIAYLVNQLAGEEFAIAHHGSVSRERREYAEQALREGRLRLLCATSSMELGIDVGDIDLVLQIGCPRTVSSTLQRLGRAGHSPGRVSVMRIFPRTPAEGLMCGITAELARNGKIEPATPPRGCLDVLAQHLVSMAAAGEFTFKDVRAVTDRAYPFTGVTDGQIEGVLRMLAGDFEHGQDIPARPRLLYDRVNGRARGDAYSRILALSAGGTIPDRGLFTVRGENGVRFGEVDEEFVFEARVGDKFLLGAFAWRIANITHDEVLVTQTGVEGAQPPFWKGEIIGRPLQTGMAYGKLMRALSEAAIDVVNEKEERAGIKTAYEETPKDKLDIALLGLGMDGRSADAAKGIILRQVEATGALPDDRTIIVEHFYNEVSENQLVVHSIFGRRINSPLAFLARESARHILGVDVAVYDDDEGFLLLPVGGKEPPDGLLYTIDPSSARAVLNALLPATPVFSMAFRYNAARALMMGVRKRGRQPLWVQRQRGSKMLDDCFKEKGHPLVEETLRECQEDYWDFPGLEYVLGAIRSGEIAVKEVYSEHPSPLSLPLRRAVENELMYDYTPTPPSVSEIARGAVSEAISGVKAIAPGRRELEETGRREHVFADEHHLHALLMMEGDQVAGEVEAPVEWFEELAAQGRALYIEPGLWIAAEHADEYAAAFAGVHDLSGLAGPDDFSAAPDYIFQQDAGRDTETGIYDIPTEVAPAINEAAFLARRHIVRRALRYHGGHTPDQVTDRYAWPDSITSEVLGALAKDGEITRDGDEYFHSELYEIARRKTISARRAMVKTQPRRRYAALMASRAGGGGSGAPAERALAALRAMCGPPFPAAVWESVLLPSRVPNYRPDSLDAALARGEIIWTITDGQTLAFRQYEDIDWDAPPIAEQYAINDLLTDELIIIDALKKRGAQFTQGLTAALGGDSPYDALLRLVSKGLVRSDSFMPVRQLLEQDKIQKTTVRQRAHARSQMLASGRWELARSIVEIPMEAQIERAFAASPLLCRETAPQLPWRRALETLRVWEYTGRARRGYYVEGLSGAQFVREEDFAHVTAALARIDSPVAWLPALDPAQPWGKSLQHLPGRSFMNLPGAVVCLIGGLPELIIERQGQSLRALDPAHVNAEKLDGALKDFVDAYMRRRFYQQKNSLTVKQYPAEITENLLRAGFVRYMNDLVLYRR